MKNSLRKSLIVALTAIVAMLFVIVMALNVNVAKADAITITIPEDAIAPRVTGEWIDDFYVIDGGSVRRETEGLKFTTVISKAYLQHLEGQGTVEFFATAKKAGGTAQAVTFKYQPTSATMPNDTFNLNTYLNFDEYDGDMDAALATEFIIETYAKITPNEGDPTYVRAYKPEGNDIARSMQVVANAHYLASGDNNLKAYFTEGNRSTTDTGFVSLEDGSSKLTMPKMDLEGTVNAYVGTKKHSGTVDEDGKLVLSGINVDGVESAEMVDVSIFNGNTVYSTKLVAADMALDASNISILHDLSDVAYKDDEALNEIRQGYFVLKDDVDMSTVSWAVYAYIGSGGFQGTLDGQGYEIQNFTPNYNNGYLGSFLGYTENSTFKNFAMTNVTLPRFSTPIATRAKNATFENLSITVSEVTKGNSSVCGTNTGLVALNLGNLSLKDVYIKLPELATYTNSTNFISTHTHGSMTLDNVFFVGGTTSSGVRTNINATTTDGVTTENASNINGVEGIDYNFFDTEATFYSDVKAKLVSVTDLIKNNLRTYEQLKQAYGFVEITKDNITSLVGLNSGAWASSYLVLANDIDMKEVTWTAHTEHTTKFTGIFDGMGYCINNFTTATTQFYGSLFSAMTNATVRNLYMTNVTLKGSNAAIVGRVGINQNDSDPNKNVYTYFENVAVQVISANSKQQAAVACVNDGMACKNVVVSMPNNLTVTPGYISAGAYSRAVEIDGVYCIGGQISTGYLEIAQNNHSSLVPVLYKVGRLETAVINDDYYIFETADDMRTAVSSQQATAPYGVMTMLNKILPAA